MESLNGLPLITWHALQRWQERVDPSASPIEARLAIVHFLTHGRPQSKPRHWTDIAPGPGLEFVYWSGLPGVCALMRGSAVVTVVTRRSRPPIPRRYRRTEREMPRRRAVPYLVLFPRWRWDGRVDWTGYDETDYDEAA